MSTEEPSAAELTRQRRRVWLSVGVLSTLALLGALASSLPLLTSPSSSAASEQRAGAVLPVRGVKTERGDLVLRAEYTGELDTEAADLAAQVTGRLESLEVDIGDFVEQGKTLARIDASMALRQLAEARAQSDAARAAEARAQAELEAAEVEVARAERMSQAGLVADKELDGLRARVRVLQADRDRALAQHEEARARLALLARNLQETRIIAPFAGAVADRFLDPGALVQPGTRVLRLVRRGPLKVRFRVPERDLGRLRTGMELAVTTQASEGRWFRATISRISPEVSRTDRTAAVEGLLSEETPLLRAGMYAYLAVTLGKLSQVVTVPSIALVERALPGGERAQGVFVIEGGRARFRRVRILGTDGERSAVEGVPVQATVVTTGQESLRDGQAVRMVEGPRP